MHLVFALRGGGAAWQFESEMENGMHRWALVVHEGDVGWGVHCVKETALSDLDCMAGRICIGMRRGGHCAEWDSSMDG